MVDTSTNILRRLSREPNSTVWRRFYERYRGLVRGFAMRMGLADSDQDEVLQETMLAAFRGLNFDGLTGPRARAWLRSVSRRKIMDILRERYRRKRSDEIALKTASVSDLRAELHQAWEEEWQVELLERALELVRQQTPPKMYQAFDLFALRNHDPLQVAKTLGISRNLVYLHKLRVTERLRKAVLLLAKRLD